ncbi:D-alanine--D-alanine ligase [Candidatus Syntrophocurvum alkaliphilum]|uniref:D-alanine--D-alanine ligase n=1 Tax=Candidatus Syntrophocurvum alkaliphilum TaxID=2293317 RepID=A0A6I6DA86_9FIRM|nr:D-alanine--D-alanine ligase [Candidatus Syntrophocurvum alkaliphilum]QGT99309.1 D-alanine--D-alanine ligase [Candidatus Syntrophocurvum alkaliphilum]
MKSLKVVVLMGGRSEEREVSLRSGKAVYEALLSKGYDAVALDIKDTNIFKLQEIKPDVAFIVLHGKFGEDGTVQGMLELLDIPYTGSGVASSAICIDKVISKKLYVYEKIPTADFMILNIKDFDNKDTIVSKITNTLGLPVVVKAATQGSSIGTSIVKSEDEIIKALESSFMLDKQVLVEKFIEGVEVTAAVIGNENPTVLPIIEITSENEFFDFESKYTPGMCDHIIPARIDEATEEKIKDITEKVYTSLNCRGCSRVDFMIDKQGNPYVLEINTIPGMTEMSLLPDAGRAAGLEFEDLVEKLLKLALED